MTATLKAVQWLRIADLVSLFAERNRGIPPDVVADELRRGWFKWSNEQNGVPGFRCGEKLKRLPLERELPPLDQQVSREFIYRFAQEQGWAIPLALAGDLLPKRDAPGRPPKRTNEVIERYKSIIEAGELRASLKADAASLRAWAMATFPDDDVASAQTIANKISPLRRAAIHRQ